MEFILTQRLRCLNVGHKADQTRLRQTHEEENGQNVLSFLLVPYFGNWLGTLFPVHDISRFDRWQTDKLDPISGNGSCRVGWIAPWSCSYTIRYRVLDLQTYQRLLLH